MFQCSVIKLYIILTVFQKWFTRADQIDNGLVEDPSIKCGSENVLVQIKTNGAFEGHMYMKGHYNMKNCRSDATLDTRANLTISYSSCNVVKQRSSNPKGIMMTAIIIVSFHPMFITKIDRSYKIQCFYAESSTVVTKQLNVDIAKQQEKNILVIVGDEDTPQVENMKNEKGKILRNPPVKKIDYNVHLPTCHYKVYNEARNEEVKFVTVGQLVYHEWSCSSGDSNEESPFCVTVHSCNVNDETGKEVQLIDENGCAVDKYLINNLEYTNALSGGQFSQVFKFADQPSVFFQCKIRIDLKNEEKKCIRSSDHCPVTLRGKRSIKSNEDNFDVISQTMTVLDINEQLKTNKQTSTNIFSKLFLASDVCVSFSTASGLLALILMTVLVCLIFSILLCYRHQTVKLKFSH